MRLYDLYEKYFAFHGKIDEQFGEVTDEDLKAEEEIDESLDWHLDNQAKKFNEAKAEAEKCKELARQYKARQESFERSMDFRKKIIDQLVRMKGGKHKSAVATIYISKAQASLEISDSRLVPKEYKRIEEVINNQALKKSLAAGEKVEGAELVEGKEFVVVRV